MSAYIDLSVLSDKEQTRVLDKIRSLLEFPSLEYFNRLEEFLLRTEGSENMMLTLLLHGQGTSDTLQSRLTELLAEPEVDDQLLAHALTSIFDYSSVLRDTPVWELDRNVYEAFTYHSFADNPEEEVIRGLLRVLLECDDPGWLDDLEVEIIDDMIENGALDLEWAAKSFREGSRVAAHYKSMTA